MQWMMFDEEGSVWWHHRY